jgi:hypothetical protein
MKSESLAVTGHRYFVIVLGDLLRYIGKNFFGKKFILFYLEKSEKFLKWEDFA